MRFVLIDRITELQPGQSLVAVKNLSLAEEYLADHFPGFPVMPGVLMLEALTQAGAWLVRDMEDFAHSVVVLKKAKMIKYGSFVEPGRQLQLKVTLVSHDDREASFKGEGTIDGQEMVKGQFTLTGTTSATATRPCTPPTPRSSPGSATCSRRCARVRSAPGPWSATAAPARPDGGPGRAIGGLKVGRTGRSGSRAALLMLQGFPKYIKMGPEAWNAG